ncbi:hypothetical protein BGZ68_007280 [Mortierella alpina]|nr:hypothetical protein BGZ68_007280 [Mortierella alpina]
MRAHSLDSLMLQVGSREPQVMIINSGESSPLRRHSQGHALMNGTPNTTVDPQADHHSYFSVTFQPYPSPSSYGAQAPLDIHPLEQQYHYQQQQTYGQLPSALVQQTSTLPSPPYASPTFFTLQYDASGLPTRPMAIPHSQETIQNLDDKDRMASARTLNHFETMQQSLPHTKHQRRHLTQGARPSEQGFQSPQEQQLQQWQQQQQHPSPAAEWSLSLSPLPTAPSFRDPRAFEEYKHQQFILEHKRLQQQELTEQRQQQQHQHQQQQQQQHQECPVATRGHEHSLSAVGLPAGSTTIATAQNAISAAQNAPYQQSS